MSFDRRNFMKKMGLGTLSGIVAAKAVADDTCKYMVTPRQPEGPFYPREFPLDANADLTKVKGHLKEAEGEVVVIHGIIQDQFCRPIEGAIVEVWQACHTGKYNHPSDTSTEKLDPHFQYYALMRTNTKGEYSYKTILPGAYKANQSWVRPPHIHYKVSLRGHETLITQLYFKGNKLNERDHILRELSEKEKKNIIIDFKKNEKGVLQGHFIINLRKL